MFSFSDACHRWINSKDLLFKECAYKLKSNTVGGAFMSTFNVFVRVFSNMWHILLWLILWKGSFSRQKIVFKRNSMVDFLFARSRQRKSIILQWVNQWHKRRKGNEFMQFVCIEIFFLLLPLFAFRMSETYFPCNLEQLLFACFYRINHFKFNYTLCTQIYIFLAMSLAPTKKPASIRSIINRKVVCVLSLSFVLKMFEKIKYTLCCTC